MPGGDRTGPAGFGPMTGRAAGYCAGYTVPGYMNPIPGRTAYSLPMAYQAAYSRPFSYAPSTPLAYGAYPGFGWGRGRGRYRGRGRSFGAGFGYW